MATAGHSISIAFVRGAVGALDREQRSAVLAEAGIAGELLAQPAARVPARAFATLWMAVARVLDDEFFGLDARRMKPGSFALLTHAAAGQGTVERGLKQVLRGFALLLDDIDAALSITGRDACITLANRIKRDHQNRDDARRFADETLLVMIHGLLCFLAGRRVALTRLDWAHTRPAHSDEFRSMFTPLQQFEQAATTIHFDARILAAPIAVDAAALATFLRDAPQSVFLKQVAPSALAERVRRLARRSLLDRSESPALESLAATLDMAPSTLRRRLEDEGAGWQQLKDGVRRDLAIQRLADQRLTLDDVAAQLGFNDTSSFHRAFRKWTGSPPGAWRRQP